MLGIKSRAPTVLVTRIVTRERSSPDGEAIRRNLISTNGKRIDPVFLYQVGHGDGIQIPTGHGPGV